MDVDVVVVGAGPAGLKAATRIAEDTTASVLVIDEASEPGGKLPGQLYAHRGRWHVGAYQAAQMYKEAINAGVSVRMETQVWRCEPEWTLHLDSGESIHAHAVILATGAVEIPHPLPGWTLPGVFAVGAVQNLIHVQQILPGQRVAVIGGTVLAYAAAQELALAGGDVVGIYQAARQTDLQSPITPADTLQQLADFANAAPNPVLRLGAKMLRSRPISSIVARSIPRNGIKINGLPLRPYHQVASIEGRNQAEYIQVQKLYSSGPHRGSRNRVPIDAVCLTGGLTPLQELTTNNCELVNMVELGGTVPLHSPELRTTAPNLYVAGNITGIEGAAIAAAQGNLVGATVAADLKGYSDAHRVISTAKKQLEQTRQRAMIHFLPNIYSGREQMKHRWALHHDAPEPQTGAQS